MKNKASRNGIWSRLLSRKPHASDSRNETPAEKSAPRFFYVDMQSLQIVEPPEPLPTADQGDAASNRTARL